MGIEGAEVHFLSLIVLYLRHAVAIVGVGVVYQVAVGVAEEGVGCCGGIFVCSPCCPLLIVLICGCLAVAEM